MVTIYKED